MTFSRTVTAVVVDASVVVEMLGGDQTWIDRFADWRRRGTIVLAPPHFMSEIANALLRGVGLDASDAVARLQQLFTFGVDIADRGVLGISDAVELAQRHRLSVYDAAYLSLVLDVAGQIATNDRALARAARAEGVSVIS
jgi:predicted nucleic acid-binding protein